MELQQRIEVFMLYYNAPPDFCDRLPGKDYCRWCFSPEVTHVTDENQLAVLTALARHDFNESCESKDSDDSDLKGCEAN